MTDRSPFPDDFQWGAATSAYQIEGSPLADGAGPGIWQRFTHSPGLTSSGATGDVACDHYNRWPEDIKLMAELGLTAYRFSISWSRILPDGTGRVNQPGVDFYSRLVDGLLERGITPFCTLYQWNMPAALDDHGGWLNRDSANWFADYAQVMYRALDGRVRHWTTLNEPWTVVDGGYLHGALAPGHRNLFEAPLASHNLLRAHGAAVKAYRAEGAHEIGLVVNLEPKYPANKRPETEAATRRADAYMNRQYLDPVFLGRYPDELREIFGEAWPEPSDEDMALIKQPLDFIGVNYYTRSVTVEDQKALPVRAGRVKQDGATYTETDWEVYPQGLVDILGWVTERYGATPLYVTENGAAFFDPPVPLADPHPDPLRVDYFRQHLVAIRQAISNGVPLRGYFAWSLLDNFEWSEGFTKRFGIIHVNYATQKRTFKTSARFYADVIRTRGAALDDG